MHDPSSHLAAYRQLNLSDLQLDVLLRMLKMSADADGVVRVATAALLEAITPELGDDERLDALRDVLDVLASKVHTIQPDAQRRATFVLLAMFSFDDAAGSLQFQISPLALSFLRLNQP